MVAGWINCHQQQVIAYFQEENRILKARLGKQRLWLTDTERRRLAVLAHPIGPKRLKQCAILATPDTLMRWWAHGVRWTASPSSPWPCGAPGERP